jgi:hypothetical protein
VYQGEVCGIAPRPDYGYTVRYPKIWEARELGPTTWLADLGNDGLVKEQIGETVPIGAPSNTSTPRLIGAISVTPDPVPGADLEAGLRAGWQSRGLDDLRLDASGSQSVGGNSGVRLTVHFTGDDGTPMAGYTAAALVNGSLYRVEIAMPADQYARRERAAEIVADQLLING